MIKYKNAKFIHDCDNCVFLGQYEEYDLYFCNNNNPTVIARYGDNGEDYTSGLSFAKPDISKPLYEAKLKAIKMGLLKD